MKKKIIKVLVILILIINLFIPLNNEASAKTLGQLKQELSNAEQKYSNNQSEKEKTEAEISATKNKINALNKEKIQIQDEIHALEQELEQLAKDIEKMEKEVKAIMNYYQLSNSESTYMEYVFDSDSLTDFIYRLAVTEQLSKYQTDTINKYNELIEENKKKISDLEKKQVSLNKLQNELSVQLANLGKELASISDASYDIKEEINDLKSQIKLYQNTYKCSDNEELSVCINRYNSQSAVPSSAGFYRPTKSGRVNADYGYTSYYGSNFHYGLDVGVSHGTPVYSVANGVVVKVSYRSSCGGNMVYVGHSVNGKSYTSLYAHLASINVKQGQVVTYNTQIGTSGGVPSIEYWDACSTGAHLHFQIATGIYTTDYFWFSIFQSRSFNPRNVISFPAWRTYYSTR